MNSVKVACRAEGRVWSNVCVPVYAVIALHLHPEVFGLQKHQASETSQVPSRCWTRHVGFFSVSTSVRSHRRRPLLSQYLTRVNTHD